MTSTEDARLIPFPGPEDPHGVDDNHPLGPAITALDDVVDRAWERLRGRPVADRIFYVASQLADFSLLWHLLGVARGLGSDQGIREAARLSAALAVESALVNGAMKSLFQRERPVTLEKGPTTCGNR